MVEGVKCFKKGENPILMTRSEDFSSELFLYLEAKGGVCVNT